MTRLYFGRLSLDLFCTCEHCTQPWDSVRDITPEQRAWLVRSVVYTSLIGLHIPYSSPTLQFKQAPVYKSEREKKKKERFEL
jgi:hypothetical protein